MPDGDETGMNKLTNTISSLIKPQLAGATGGWEQHVSGITAAFKQIGERVDQIKAKFGSLTDVIPGAKGGPDGAAGAGVAVPNPSALLAAALGGAGGVIDVRIVNDPLHVVMVKEQKPRTTFWQKLWGGVTDIFDKGASWISTFVAGITSGVGGLLGGFLGGIAGGAVGGVLTPWVLVDMLKQIRLIVRDIIELVKVLPVIAPPTLAILNMVDGVLARVQSMLRDILSFVIWLVQGFAADGWLTKTLKGFIDSLLLWATDRIGRILEWVSRVLQVVQKWLFPTVSALIENAINTLLNTLIGVALSRVMNIVNATIGLFYGAFRAIIEGFKEVFRWLGEMFESLGTMFANSIIRGFNAAAKRLADASQELSAKTKGFIPVIPLFQIAELAEKKLKPLDIVGAMKNGFDQGQKDAQKTFPINMDSESVKQTTIGKLLLGSQANLRDLPELKIPGLKLDEVAAAKGHPTVTEMGAPLTVQGGINITIVAGSVSSDNLDALARALGERVMEELERVGRMRLSRQGQALPTGP